MPVTVLTLPYLKKVQNYKFVFTYLHIFVNFLFTIFASSNGYQHVELFLTFKKNHRVKLQLSLYIDELSIVVSIKSIYEQILEPIKVHGLTPKYKIVKLVESDVHQVFVTDKLNLILGVTNLLVGPPTHHELLNFQTLNRIDKSKN